MSALFPQANIRVTHGHVCFGAKTRLMQCSKAAALVGQREQHGRYFEAERLGGRQIVD
jgi:hypothetical protein